MSDRYVASEHSAARHLLTGVLVGLLIGGGVAANMLLSKEYRWRHEAVERGKAEYVITKDGWKQWRWKP